MYAQCPMANDQAARASLFDCVSRTLVIGAWSLIGHWSLVIGHWSFDRARRLKAGLQTAGPSGLFVRRHPCTRVGMRNILLPVFVLTWIGCSPMPSRHEASTQDADAALAVLSDEFLAGYLAWRP